MSKLNLAVIPGDGTGPEVTAEALKVLDAVAKLEKFEYTTTRFDWGGERYCARARRCLPAARTSCVSSTRSISALSATPM